MGEKNGKLVSLVSYLVENFALYLKITLEIHSAQAAQGQLAVKVTSENANTALRMGPMVMFHFYRG
jgi:hypothetical protein